MIRLALALLLALGTTVSAGLPPPGTVVTKENIDNYRDALFPSLEYFLRNGMEIPVIESRPYEWPLPYAAATAKFASQVTLSSDGRDMQATSQAHRFRRSTRTIRRPL